MNPEYTAAIQSQSYDGEKTQVGLLITNISTGATFTRTIGSNNPSSAWLNEQADLVAAEIDLNEDFLASINVGETVG